MKRISYRHKVKRLSIFAVVGIVSIALLIFVSAFYILSPAISSYAEEGANTKVNLTVSPVASISVDAENIDFDITPTPEGVFESKQVTASVLTNSSGGYELYFSSIDNRTDLISQTVSTVIPSDFNNTVTSLSMPANNWGYSMNDTDFLKIPSVSNQVTLRNIDHLPSIEEQNTTVSIGVKIDSSILSGTYTKNLVFSVLAHATPTPIPMQSFDKTILENVGDSVLVIDERDDSIYVARKLADGNVWMTSNLKLQNETLTSNDSDLPSGVTYSLPASDIANFDSTYNKGAVYIDSTYGGYYTFYGATAGWGTLEVSSGNSPQSICPKGWRMPTIADFQTLYGIYTTIPQISGIPGFALSGGIYDGVLKYQDIHGFFWSSSVYEAGRIYAYGLSIDTADGEVGRSINTKYNGGPVRCIAR